MNNSIKPEELLISAQSAFSKSDFATAIKSLAKILEDNPQNLEARNALAQAFLNLGKYTNALQEFYRILSLDPKNMLVRSKIRALHLKLVDAWHPAMINDGYRNELFQKAISKTVKPGMQVLEIGTGSGLLAMLAVKAGAEHVYTCEQSYPLALAAQKIIEKNGFKDKITVFNCWSNELVVGKQIPKKADLLIAEIIGASLLDEHIGKFLTHAKTELLKPNAVILPKAGDVYGIFLESADIQSRVKVGKVLDFDLSLFNALYDEANVKVHLHKETHKILSKSFLLFETNFEKDIPIDAEKILDVDVINDGVVHGIALWFNLKLTDGILLSTSPEEKDTHWGQLVQVFDNPLRVAKGDKIKIKARFFHDRIAFSLV